MHPGARDFRRQGRPQGQGGGNQQDQESKRNKENAGPRAQRRPRRGGMGRPPRFGMPCMM
jgi:hypothetical protein